jgi:hypothetical protein
LFVAGTTAAAAAAAASSDSYGSADSTLVDDEEAERVQQAVEVVAEMQLTAEQLKVRKLYGMPAAVPKDCKLGTATTRMQVGTGSRKIQPLLCLEHAAASQGCRCVQAAFAPCHASTAKLRLQQLAECSSAALSVFCRLACAPCRLL